MNYFISLGSGSGDFNRNQRGNEYQNLSGELERMKRRNEELIQQLQNQQEENVRLKALCERRENQIRRLGGRERVNGELVQELEDFQRRLKEQQDENDKLIRKLDEKERVNERLTMSLKEQQSNNKQLNQDLKEQQSRNEQLAQELENYQVVIEKYGKNIRSEVERNVREEEEDRIRLSVRYNVRRRADEALLEEVRNSAGDQQQFQEEVCDRINRTDRLFQQHTNQLADRMQEMQQKMQKEMKLEMEKAINQMVDISRAIRSRDYELLVENFCSLQETLYYRVSEKELGLAETKIERYLKRFLRVLAKLGLECVIPEPGDEFDSYWHEAVEPREDEPEEAPGKTETAAYGRGSADVSLPAEEFQAGKGTEESLESMPKESRREPADDVQGAGMHHVSGSENSQEEKSEAPHMPETGSVELSQEEKQKEACAALVREVLESSRREETHVYRIKDIVSYGFHFEGRQLARAKVTLI